MPISPLPEILRTPTWIVLVGQASTFARKSSPDIEALARWLRRTIRAPLDAGDSPHRVVAIWPGALLAARAGLIGDHQRTTSHELRDLVRTLTPRAEFVDNLMSMALAKREFAPAEPA